MYLFLVIYQDMRYSSCRYISYFIYMLQNEMHQFRNLRLVLAVSPTAYLPSPLINFEIFALPVTVTSRSWFTASFSDSLPARNFSNYDCLKRYYIRPNWVKIRFTWMAEFCPNCYVSSILFNILNPFPNHCFDVNDWYRYIKWLQV